MAYRIAFTPIARDDLKMIRGFIRDQSPSGAKVWSREIRRRIQTLARNPFRCPIAPERFYLGYELRELFYGSGNRGTYRILFTVVDNAVVVIVHVRHGSREPADFSEN
jgi:plasmid stabilization system protein ParE